MIRSVSVEAILRAEIVVSQAKLALAILDAAMAEEYANDDPKLLVDVAADVAAAEIDLDVRRESLRYHLECMSDLGCENDPPPELRLVQ